MAECRKRQQDEAGKRGTAAVAAQDATAEEHAEQVKTVRAVELAHVGEYQDYDLGADIDHSLGWVMAVVAAKDSEQMPLDIGSLLLDSGSDEHMCPLKGHDDADTLVSEDPSMLRDVQGKIVADQGRIRATMNFKEIGTDELVRASSCFTVGNFTEPLLSAGEIVRSEGVVHLEGGDKSYADLGGRRIPVIMVGNRFGPEPVRTVAALGDRLGASSSSSLGSSGPAAPAEAVAPSAPIVGASGAARVTP